MSTLYPVREASEEDAHLTTADADVLALLSDDSTGDTVHRNGLKAWLPWPLLCQGLEAPHPKHNL